MQEPRPSTHLFYPKAGHLTSFQPLAPDVARAEAVAGEIQNLLSQKSYPCVAALSSFHQNEYQVGLYGRLGRGEHWQTLREDLRFFLQQQSQTNSTYLTFWAVFEPELFDEEQFERALFQELSFLTSEDDREHDWPVEAESDPNQPSFQFCLDGREFFVVGLHTQSSRIARRFAYPTLIFNVFAQFEELERLGQYEPMVKMNRKRDKQLQGNVNPMALAHGEKWETIQFSGRANSNTWKCPFSFLKRWTKPKA